jgi:hypothetical protein
MAGEPGALLRRAARKGAEVENQKIRDATTGSDHAFLAFASGCRRTKCSEGVRTLQLQATYKIRDAAGREGRSGPCPSSQVVMLLGRASACASAPGAQLALNRQHGEPSQIGLSSTSK